MNDALIAILARDLSKIYRIYKNPLDAVREALTRKPRHIPRAALNHVNLEVRRGEIIGIMGRNGAGKSTLLKIIAGTLERTSGQLDVRGRITAILELGSGFHPDYTGRENIYMGGMCLGMSKKEVDTKLESIIEFSELRDVMDQPFKTYSTGMQARLTFSVAISVDPDILIVDEALSVGDARFQLKCFTRLHELREKSTTILLVSHDINTITTLCDRGLILEGGQIYAEGDAKSMSIAYHNLLFGEQPLATKNEAAVVENVSNENGGTKSESIHLAMANEPGDFESQQAQPANAVLTQKGEIESEGLPRPLPSSSADPEPQPAQPTSASLPDPAIRYGTGEAKLVDWGFLDERGQSCTVIESGKQCRIYMVLDCARDIDDLSCGFNIKDRRGTILWGVTNLTQKQPPYKARAGCRLIISADCVMWLSAGDYFVTLGAAHLADGNKIDFAEEAIGFKVLGPEGVFTTACVNLQTEFKIKSAPANRTVEA